MWRFRRFRYLKTQIEIPIAHKPPIDKRVIRRVERWRPDAGALEGEAVDSAPVDAVAGEGTKRVLNFEVSG